MFFLLSSVVMSHVVFETVVIVFSLTFLTLAVCPCFFSNSGMG